MRYIGGKSLLCEEIHNIIKQNTVDVKEVIDIFAGSGAVSKFLKEQNFKVYSNDFLYFSYVINRGTIGINTEPTFNDLPIKNPIIFLNNLKFEDTDISINDCFIHNNYSPNKKCQRMYFTNDNAIKIDIIRITIEKWHKLFINIFVICCSICKQHNWNIWCIFKILGQTSTKRPCIRKTTDFSI